MSIQKQRNSLISSSNSINSIRDSVSNFSKGLGRTSSLASGIIDQTRKTNIFTSRLIRKDDEYFNKRRENVRRKQREDELESTSIRGVEKKQGNIVQRSTKGFLGRILDFFGIVLIGWFVNSLPKILDSITALIKKITQLTTFLSNFIEGVSDFFVSMGLGLKEAMESLPKFDFLKLRKEITDETDQSAGALTLLNLEFQDGLIDFDKAVEAEVKTKDVNKDLEMQYGGGIDEAYEEGMAEATQEQDQQNQEEEQKKDNDNLEDISILRGIQGFADIITGNKFDFDNKNEQEDTTEESGNVDQTEEPFSIDPIDKEIDKSVDLVNKQKEKDSQIVSDNEKDIQQQQKKLKSTIGDVSKRDLNKKKKTVSPLLARRFKEKTAKKPITVNGVNYNPGDEGYDDAINMIKGVASEAGAILPIRGDERNLVKNKKSGGTTLIIQEVAVNRGNTPSTGGSGEGTMETFNISSDPIKKAQTLILNS